MMRRTHKKSRAGCNVCKQRHVKCDENRPRCVNCSTANRECAYTNRRQPQPTASPSNSLNSSAPSSTATPDRRHAAGPNKTPNSLSYDATLNLDHMELLHHFCTVTYRTLSPDPVQQEIWQTVAIQNALSYPFLMREIMAIAALHLAYCRPDRQVSYCNKATELQSQALEGFYAFQDQIDASSCGSVLLFSSFIALHVLADKSRTQGVSVSEYIDHILNCINLMRSVRNLVISDWFRHLANTELGPLLAIQDPSKPYDYIPQEVNELANLPHSCDLGPGSIAAYEHAIERLQWVFALSDVLSTSHSTVRHLLAWPVQLNTEYAQLLNERRPEALVILAYFGALLHFYRATWVVGDSGAVLVHTIDTQLGSFWEKWMAWPLKITESAINTASSG